jgi:hypothetical protein
MDYHAVEIAEDFIPILIKEIDNGSNVITAMYDESSSGAPIIHIDDKTISEVKVKIEKKDQKAISDYIISRLGKK